MGWIAFECYCQRACGTMLIKEAIFIDAYFEMRKYYYFHSHKKNQEAIEATLKPITVPTLNLRFKSRVAAFVPPTQIHSSVSAPLVLWDSQNRLSMLHNDCVCLI